MANTYTKIFLHIVFAVKFRRCLIRPEWKDELYKYITGIVQNSGHKLIAINGMPDHLHVFVGYKPHQPIPDLLRDIKGESSRWINERRLVRGKFRWQPGYAAFSCGYSQIGRVATYIESQEAHHKRKSFEKEYLALLKKYQVDFDKRYLLNDLG